MNGGKWPPSGRHIAFTFCSAVAWLSVDKSLTVYIFQQIICVAGT